MVHRNGKVSDRDCLEIFGEQDSVYILRNKDGESVTQPWRTFQKVRKVSLARRNRHKNIKLYSTFDQKSHIGHVQMYELLLIYTHGRAFLVLRLPQPL